MSCFGLEGGSAYTYCCGTELDGFERVFDLEETAFGGEGAGGIDCKLAGDLVGIESDGCLLDTAVCTDIWSAGVKNDKSKGKTKLPYSDRAMNMMAVVLVE